MKNITKVMQQKGPENYANHSNRIYSVKASDMMSAEELIEGIRSKIQSILMQSNGGSRKNVNYGNQETPNPANQMRKAIKELQREKDKWIKRG